MTDMRLVVVGAAGRMGRTLVRTIAETEGAVLAGATARPGSAAVGQDAGALAGLGQAGLGQVGLGQAGLGQAGLGEAGIAITDDPAAALASADGIVDFSSPAATVALAALAAERGLVHVVGTTGLSEADLAQLADAAKRAVIVRSGNMSLGVNLLAALVRRVARTLDADFDIEIVEMHHRQKVDAPSGTALLLGEAAAAGRGVALAERSVRARDGHTGARRPGDIGFAALRGGTVVGDHSVVFAGPGERIELVHRAEDRGIFARGAVKAALWGRGRAPGLYSMADVLGIGEI